MCMKQLQRPRLNTGKIRLIRTGKLAPDPRGGRRVTVIGSAFRRFR